MFGYPFGLPTPNSMPIARVGYCATACDGDGEFMADIATISGSSGSPLWFVAKDFAVDTIEEDAKVHVNESYQFAGMVFSGAEHEDGKFDINNPRHDIHLGKILSAAKIFQFINKYALQLSTISY